MCNLEPNVWPRHDIHYFHLLLPCQHPNQSSLTPPVVLALYAVHWLTNSTRLWKALSYSHEEPKISNHTVSRILKRGSWSCRWWLPGELRL
ncbi:hypothetical protein ILYODFUR_012234 [Ilyodon furcidens]|uniref:Uncharacterized protein n=1 Tax=Ilyodon furcidens TaxID=33524 RepID=A0ABV0UHA0_9TELE